MPWAVRPSDRRCFRASHALLALGVVMLAACGGGDATDEARVAGDAERSLDELRSLPYIGFAGETSEEQSGTVHHDPARTAPGYNLYTVRPLAMAELVDARGALVQRWTGPGGLWSRVHLLDDGDLLIVGKERFRYVMRQSWTGEVRWRHDMPAHHDIRLTPDGKVATLTMHERSLPEIAPGRVVRDDAVTIFDGPTGETIDRLSLYDAMEAGGFAFQDVAPGPKHGHVDLLHANSVRWMTDPALHDRDRIYAAGNVIVSIRHQDTIAIFDVDARELLWAWGQGEISGPHDAHVLPSGNLLIFDNGLGRTWSRVIELDPLRREIVWSYRAPHVYDFYTRGRGSNQRLENGNTLITESDTGRVFEVTTDGEVVWEYFSPHFRDGQRATLIRCYRIPPTRVDRLVERFGPSTAGP